jgi:hypothetical protein
MADRPQRRDHLRRQRRQLDPDVAPQLDPKGGFYGFVSDPGRTNAAHPAPKRGEPEKPLCWIPKPQDNSRADRCG